jgi:hypothetical protein
MTEAAKILELIENVDPKDTDTLDEIDVQVWCWLNNYTLDVYDDVEYGYFKVKENPEEEYNIGEYEFLYESDKEKYHQKYYTRSRDALKSIRPEGWRVDIAQSSEHKDFRCILVNDECRCQGGKYLPTEELAELHSIIQAIQWERENK